MLSESCSSCTCASIADRPARRDGVRRGVEKISAARRADPNSTLPPSATASGNFLLRLGVLAGVGRPCPSGFSSDGREAVRSSSADCRLFCSGESGSTNAVRFVTRDDFRTPGDASSGPSGEEGGGDRVDVLNVLCGDDARTDGRTRKPARRGMRDGGESNIGP